MTTFVISLRTALILILLGGINISATAQITIREAPVSGPASRAPFRFDQPITDEQWQKGKDFLVQWNRSMLVMLQNRMIDPRSFELVRADFARTGILCVHYRTQKMPAQAVYIDGDMLTSDDRDKSRFERAWQANCSPAMGWDITEDIRAGTAW